MKKWILLSLILFGIEANMFCYSWRVVNNSDEDSINVQLCTENNYCESLPIPRGGGEMFSFGQPYNINRPLGSVSVNRQAFNVDQLGLAKNISMGGKFSIRGNSKTGYSFSD